ncbi:hypothetical protein GRF29_161g510469 [Pseudopithomyces chartarum]|uniref:Alpha/beta hydrolase fold-3 domain-containing protein n=1 Tax=Pseudopithomyces chartarum TaxID=1892770 RepID=A0AAN6LU08_9PLEO|nr:hypothetical protein GRF29_161g510469 [Pseudopithomyces chartarum]
MPLKSDLTIDASKLDRSLTDKKTQELNEKLGQIARAGPKWYEIGAAAYRKLRAEGRTAFPKPIILPEGINGTIPSREPDREIPYRMFKPENGASKGVLLHIHGGGWVLQSEASQDQYLKTMADTYELSVWCVGYRLAPEDPWPAGVNDCYDAAEWLVDNAEAEYGSPLVFACGESAGEAYSYTSGATTYHGSSRTRIIMS